MGFQLPSVEMDNLVSILLSFTLSPDSDPRTSLFIFIAWLKLSHKISLRRYQISEVRGDGGSGRVSRCSAVHRKGAN